MPLQNKWNNQIVISSPNYCNHPTRYYQVFGCAAHIKIVTPTPLTPEYVHHKCPGCRQTRTRAPLVFSPLSFGCRLSNSALNQMGLRPATV